MFVLLRTKIKTTGNAPVTKHTQGFNLGLIIHNEQLCNGVDKVAGRSPMTWNRPDLYPSHNSFLACIHPIIIINSFYKSMLEVGSKLGD